VLTLAIAAAPETTTKGSKKPARSLTLTTLVPLNVALQAGLLISAEEKSVAKLAYRNCNQAGCWAELPLEPAMLSSLSKGSSGEASLHLIDGQEINIRFSLKGFVTSRAYVPPQDISGTRLLKLTVVEVSTAITNHDATSVSAMPTSHRCEGHPNRDRITSAIPSHAIKKSHRSRLMKAMMTRSRSGFPLMVRARVSNAGSIRFARKPQNR